MISAASCYMGDQLDVLKANYVAFRHACGQTEVCHQRHLTLLVNLFDSQATVDWLSRVTDVKGSAVNTMVL